MALTKCKPKPTESEAIQYDGTAKTADEIVGFAKIQAAVGTNGTTLLVHGIPVLTNSWVIKEGPLVLVMSNALFIARYDKL